MNWATTPAASCSKPTHSRPSWSTPSSMPPTSTRCSSGRITPTVGAPTFCSRLLRRPRGQQLPAPVAHLGELDDRGRTVERYHLVAELEPLQAAHSVVPDMDRAADLDLAECRGTLVHPHLEASQYQRARGSQPADAAPDHQRPRHSGAATALRCSASALRGTADRHMTSRIATLIGSPQAFMFDAKREFLTSGVVRGDPALRRREARPQGPAARSASAPEQDTVLDRLVAALARVGRHRMGGIAE